MKLETLRNGMANVLAGALPILVVIFTTPYVVNTLGAEHYGLLTLITAIIGYFAIIDLNFTAGSLKYVSEFHSAGQTDKRDQTLTAGFFIYLAIGALGCMLVFVFAEWLATQVFSVSPNDHALAVSSLRLAAFGFLLGQVQVYLNSIPQSLRRYDQSALYETIFGIAAPIINVLVLWLGGGLYEIIWVRIVLSALNIVVLIRLVRHLLPDSRFTRPTRDVLGKLASFSGYAYLSRLASLAYTQGDKLIIGALVSMSALTYYAVPFLLANRVYGLSYRMSSVLLPAASSLAAIHQHARMEELYLYSARYVFFINCVLSLLLVAIAQEILLYWIGPEMAAAGTLILVLIALGNLLDSLTNAPSLVNDALGRPKITGLFAISRAILGLSLVYVLVQAMGVIGAAVGQLLVSAIVPAVFLIYVHGRSVPVKLGHFLKTVLVPSLPLVAAMIGIALLRQGAEPLGLLRVAEAVVLIVGVCGLYGWLLVARPEDRTALLNRLARRTPDKGRVG